MSDTPYSFGLAGGDYATPTAPPSPATSGAVIRAQALSMALGMDVRGMTDDDIVRRARTFEAYLAIGDGGAKTDDCVVVTNGMLEAGADVLCAAGGASPRNASDKAVASAVYMAMRRAERGESLGRLANKQR